MITVSNGEAKVKRLHTMRKGVVAAAVSIDNLFRAEYGDPVFKKKMDRQQLAAAKNPYARVSPYRVAMITVTYADGVSWSPKHLTGMLMCYRSFFLRRGLKFYFVWTVELQGNGKPHYHVVMWFPRGITPPFPDDAGWWSHGMSNARFCVSPVGYIAKYVSKSDGQSGHHLPKGARLWGHGGLTMVQRAGIAYACAPRWLKGLITLDSHPKRRVVETSVHRTAGGVILNFKKRLTAWVVTAGDATGWGFFSPYVLQDVGINGLTLSHSGVIECVCPEGQSFFLPHKG